VSTPLFQVQPRTGLLLALFVLIAVACGESNSPDSNANGGRSGNAGNAANGGAAAYANNCVGIDCACADAGVNKNYCSGQCVSLATDLENCGACGEACGEYQTCVNGSCTCPTGEMWCDGHCTQVANDYQNCGGCGKRCSASELCAAGSCKPNNTGCSPPCEGGQTCQNGRCSCSSGEAFCDERCVDISSDPNNCGGCDKACGADLGCSHGSCSCSRSQSACTSGCTDLQTDTKNCGSCDHACGAGQTCTAGVCKNAWADGCTDDPAHELSLREVAAFQTVKITIAAQGQAIAAKDRTIPLVQGRSALLRAYVDLGSKFSPRDFAARLTLVDDQGSTRLSQKQHISAESSEADPTTTFQIAVPGDKIGPHTTYSLQLVECAAASGSVSAARFPASGEAELGARKTGTLNITLIPVLTNSRLPDTGALSLQGYREYLEAMYPVERVNFSVGTQIKTAYPINWTTLVEQIRAQRKADSPAGNVYYYGLVKPADTLSDYCKKGCTAGIGYVTPANQAATRAAVGLAFGDEVSAATMAHEVGHNHGRNHAPCSPSKISGVDDDYPVKNGHIDVWGFDARKQVFWSPNTTNDIMGYCDPKWASAYTYKSILDRVVIVNEIDGVPVQEILPAAAYRVLIVDPDGPRWSVPFDEPIEAYGEREQADILDANGMVIKQVEVYRSRLSESDASTILVPPPDPSWVSVRVSGAPALSFAAPVTVPDAN
jgi:hypothetical protein